MIATDFYRENVTYYHSLSAVYSAEAAAWLNKEAVLDVNPLSIMVGISVKQKQALMTAEMQLALESARKANAIFPGTCSGFIFYTDFIDSDILRANFTLTQIKTIKPEVQKLNLKLGTKQECGGFGEISESPENLSPISKIRREHLLLTDFIICKIPSNIFFSFNHPNLLVQLTHDLLISRQLIKSIKPELDVMVEIGTSSYGSTPQQLKYLLDLWVYMDKWATQNNFTVYMDEAFDNPWKQNTNPRYAHYGWWKLKENKEPGAVNNYVEKVLAISSTNSGDEKLAKTGSNFWIYVVGIAGPSVALILVILLIIR